ncbi:hypothetical protein NCC49_002809 [Naganishia albida]|nr:hypothetical protein NCC49_002809 [Naganishia albida]
MAALTKKQQKLQAFRSGKGKKDRAEPEDVPEQDVLPDEDEPTTTGDAAESTEYKAKSKSKKSKEKKLKEKLAKEGAQGVDGEFKPKSEKAKGKEKEVEAKADGAVEGEEKPAKKTKKDIKQRFILFVGHMSYDTTAAGLAGHFEKEIGTKPSVRLLTTKPTPATRFHKASESRSRGIAFVEFPNSGALQAGLKLHHTMLDGKVINVELTAGGGGATEQRKQKIQERNERVGEQRKRKRDADGTEDAEGKEDAEGDAVDGDEGSTAKKARGGRRGKKTPGTETPLAPEDDPKQSGWAARKAGTFATMGEGPPPRNFGSGGRGRGRGGSSNGGRGGGRGGRGGFGGDRRKWEPTGANAMSVG